MTEPAPVSLDDPEILADAITALGEDHSVALVQALIRRMAPATAIRLIRTPTPKIDPKRAADPAALIG